jgi:lipopolysaccharide transport protein LptA
MARSSASVTLFALLLTAGAHAVPTALQLDADQPIQLDARSSDFDYKSSTLVFRGVKIAQGRLSIEADEALANGLDFKSSQWHFSGHVRISVPDGVLFSDAAAITFAANQISVAQITGAPATFEQKRQNGIARGHSASIEYRPANGTIRLSGDAWLTDGNNEISGQTLVYDLPAQRIVASAEDQGGQSIRMTIHPKTTESKPNSKQSPNPDVKPDPKPEHVAPESNPDPAPQVPKASRSGV